MPIQAKEQAQGHLLYILTFVYFGDVVSHYQFYGRIKNWLVLTDFCSLANTFFILLISKLISTDISHSND
jgi:hypothetical protein